jgi:hypothetical protein
MSDEQQNKQETALNEIQKQQDEQPERDYKRNPDFLRTPWVGLEGISPFVVEIMKARHRKKSFVDDYK